MTGPDTDPTVTTRTVRGDDAASWPGLEDRLAATSPRIEALLAAAIHETWTTPDGGSPVMAACVNEAAAILATASGSLLARRLADAEGLDPERLAYAMESTLSLPIASPVGWLTPKGAASLVLRSMREQAALAGAPPAAEVERVLAHCDQCGYTGTAGTHRCSDGLVKPVAIGVEQERPDDAT